MYEEDLLYQIAITLVPQIGVIQARFLAEHFESAADIFKAPKKILEAIEGIGTVRADAIKSFCRFSEAEKEIKFIEKYHIKPLFITGNDYPKRLLHCFDPPTMLYYRGNANLNHARMVAVIGTRSHTSYGKHLTEQLITSLHHANVSVVSGLAFGIDGIAHQEALKKNMPTIGVLAHGLQTIYPPGHQQLAKEMTKNGGLLTEFTGNTEPMKHHFPTRNRVVAGMCDAIVVIETGLKGGSMITAELANSYNRDVFAFPGKINDAKSAGCNHLIKTNKAVLLTCGEELVETMGWNDAKKTKKTSPQTELFVQLSKDEQLIVGMLREKSPMSIDEINLQSPINTSAVAAAILSLELQNLVCSLPGKQYALA